MVQQRMHPRRNSRRATLLAGPPHPGWLMANHPPQGEMAVLGAGAVQCVLSLLLTLAGACATARAHWPLLCRYK